MGILQSIIIFLGGLVLGLYLSKVLIKHSEKLKKDKLISDINSQFKQILSNISRGKSTFKNRVNNTVFIGSELNKYGNVDIVYMMDNKDVAIFKDNKCIYSSESVNKEIVSDIAHVIDRRFDKQINDVVDILGFKFYREEFEKTFKVDVEELKKQFDPNSMISDVDKIKNENETLFDINEILDKISEKGIGSLTFEERVFLDEYSRNNGEEN